MSEHEIANAIYHYRRSISAFPLMIPNIYFYNWESDILYVTDSGYVQEFEIKISHSDYLADLKKEHRHFYLREQLSCPSKFSYVCPVDVIKVDEVPEYAGLCYIQQWGDENQNRSLRWQKKPPRLKSKPITNKQTSQLLVKAVNKLWRKRMEER